MLEKILKRIQNPSRILLDLDRYKIIRLSDEFYLKLLYKIMIGKNLNLDNPQTFNEKLQWLKLNDRKDIYTTMVDKYEVKKYVADIIGKEYIIPILAIYNKFDDIDFDKLPDQFVMKCTHDSGTAIICKNKKKFNKNNARKEINKNLKRDYYRYGREWPYKNVKPRIIIEEYMEDKENTQLNDYKLMCFNGKVKCTFVCSERDNKEKGLAVTFFDNSWNKLPFQRHYRNSDKVIKQPKNFNKMIELAELLSKDLTFVRIDFYEVNNKIYFGEITFYPGAGFEEFNPPEWDKKLGSYINLEEVKKNEK